MKHIGVYRIGDAIVDLYKSVNGYYGTIFVDNYFWKFDSLKDTIHNEYEIAEIACDFGGYYNSSNRGIDVPDWVPNAEIADAISNASWWAEEVVELEELPDWYS